LIFTVIKEVIAERYGSYSNLVNSAFFERNIFIRAALKNTRSKIVA
jgi:hypothetical protein